MPVLRTAAVAAFLVLLAALPAAAQERPPVDAPRITTPAYFAVSGVAENDVLNMRAAPDADAEIVGSLPPDASPVEVIEVRGDWARIGGGEGNAWVSMHFLKPIEVKMLGESTLPAGLGCGGTEPFWSTAFASMDEAGYNYFDEEIVTFKISRAERVPSRTDVTWLRFEKDGEDYGEAVIRKEMCSDDMSDRDYPYSIHLSLGTDGEERLVTGCCNVEPAKPAPSATGSD